MGESKGPIGAVLAGGMGRRIGGGKAIVELHGRPLLGYPVGALQAVLPEVVVVAKPDTELPDLPGITVWMEPDEPRHPLAGIVHALQQAGDRPVIVAAGDLPFVDAALLRRLATEDAQGAPAVVPRAGGRSQPLLARYEPAARIPLTERLLRPGPDGPGSLRATVAALHPRELAIDDERPFFNVNLPEDLLTAAALMDRDRDPGRAPSS